MASFHEKFKAVETLLGSLCQDPYEAMAILDHVKNRHIITITQQQWENRKKTLRGNPPTKEETPNAPEKDSSGDGRSGLRTIQDGRQAGQEVPGSEHPEAGGRAKRRTGPAAQGPKPKPAVPVEVESEPKVESEVKPGSGKPPGQRGYRIPRPGDPDYVAPAPRDRKPKPVRPGEEIPDAFGGEAPPDPTDPKILVRGKGKVIGCSKCTLRAYQVTEDISQTAVITAALAKFKPLKEGIPKLETAADISILENGAITVDCPECNSVNGITLIPVQGGH